MASEDLVALVNDLRKVFQASFKVPYFQRKYEWKVTKCDALFRDLINGFDSETGLFLGPIVLMKGGDEEIIIDGQQRLVSLSLLACCFRAEFQKIRKSLESDGVSKERIESNAGQVGSLMSILTTTSSFGTQKSRIMYENEEYRETFSNVIEDWENFLEAKPSAHEGKFSLVLHRNAKRFTKLFETELSKGKVRPVASSGSSQSAVVAGKLLWMENFAQYLKDKVKFCVIYAPTMFYAVNVFSGLNARGQPLDDIDVIKSIALKHVDDDERKRQWVSGYDDVIRRYVKLKSKQGHKKDARAKDFLAKDLLSNVRKWIEVTEGHLKSVDTKQGLYSSYEDVVFPILNDRIPSQDTSVADLLLMRMARYVENIEHVLSREGWKDVFMFLGGTKSTLWEPLAVELFDLIDRKIGSVSRRFSGMVLEAAKALEQRSGICQVAGSHDSWTLFNTMLYELNDMKGELTTVTLDVAQDVSKKCVDKFRATQAEKTEFLRQLNSRTLSTKKKQDIVRYLLLVYDRSFRNTNDAVVRYDGPIDIEHICPQKIATGTWEDWDTALRNSGAAPEASSEDTLEDREYCNAEDVHTLYGLRLGNITLLGSSLNRKMGNSEYYREGKDGKPSDKCKVAALKEGEAEPSFAITRQLVNCFPRSFSPLCFKVRHMVMCSVIMKAFSLSMDDAPEDMKREFDLWWEEFHQADHDTMEMLKAFSPSWWEAEKRARAPKKRKRFVMKQTR
mmetsp:Transcript_11261/g.35739  ORF Transcript_11261/g.35739 Transcript_11261/m.35739 type:complete len:731 (-) Transcript_11261:19-2211(-)|eukprot:CAMPEP_0170740306 /NCGR_PEP_ID=MMETSP0437-20130122/5613_1 /TAXON_ID=0 /ORGANISM="Sexangularia sp." /LENGTH=730 /DNA_ID=CAMNT_0011078797 /DNA_START=75 /DNA_END=2267 /DNA_ORIENTATION=-